MFRILSPFDFQKIDCANAFESLIQYLYGCIRYCCVWVKQFTISDIASSNKLKKILTSWMFRESFSFVGACIIGGFEIN